MASEELRLARSTLSAYLGVRRGEPVTVEAWSHALPWASAFVVEARRLGADPVLAVEDEEGFFTTLALQSRGAVPTAPVRLTDRGGAYVYFSGPREFARLLALSPRELARTVARHGPSWTRRALGSGIRSARMAVAEVTPTAAERFAVGLDGWRREVVGASVVPPFRLASAATARLRRLAHASVLRVVHPNGTDLTVRLRPHGGTAETGRAPRRGGSSRQPWLRIPTGRLTIPVARRSATGVWEANRPTYHRFAGDPVDSGVRLQFAEGHPTGFSFERGGRAFADLFLRGRSFRAEVSAVRFGLNPAIVRAPESGDLALGTIGLVLRPPAERAGAAGDSDYVSLLAGADAQLDGHRWLSEGRPTQR